MNGRTINELTVGDRATIEKVISEADVLTFASLTMDTNPAHVDAEYAQRTKFKRRIVHGMFLGGLISAVLGTRLPGPGTVYVHQDFEFKAPAFIDDRVTAIVEVADIRAGEHRVLLHTYVQNEHGQILLDGQALISPPRAPRIP